MAEIHDLAVVDASNTARFPENQAPSTVNNGARALEGLLARYFFDNDTSVVATLSGSLITITANRDSLTLTLTTSNYVANFMQAFTMGSVANTGPVRVTIDAVGPIELRDNSGVSLTSSALLAGTRCLIVKDGTNNYFRLLYPITAITIGLGVGDSPQFAEVNIGHATDTTVTRSAAGVLAVEGNIIPHVARANTYTATQSVAVTALTSSAASIAVNLALGNNFSHTFTENTTLANPSNIVAGTSGQIAFTQDAGTARTLAYGSAWDFAGGTAPTVSTGLSARDTLFWYARTTAIIEAVLLKNWS